MYRDNNALIKKLAEIAEKYVATIKSEFATIASNVQIINCQEIRNVMIGSNAIINGAQSLINGTIDSSEDANTFVGNGVIAKNFIFQKGSTVKDGAMIDASLVGEGSKIGKQFSSENSVFFANSEGFHSEAVAFFGGPYSVTHHRSTLLIAAHVSFYNAGSGTNQSNHMYKLGPLHQCILERGSKTCSSSYLLWPSKVGPFTTVIGKHYSNFDTSDFPFSYITEDEGKSTIVPAMNFFTVGTIRDGEKWPKRDNRKNKDKLDLINFDVLSPFTAQKMLNSQNILMELYGNSYKGQQFVTYKGINIKRLLLKTCNRYYKIAIEKYFGDVLVKKIEKKKPSNITNLFKVSSNGNSGAGEWVDINGLLCTKDRIEYLISEITSGKINSMDDLQSALTNIYESYEDDEWNWFLSNYEKAFGKKIENETNEDLKDFINNWKKSSLKLLNMVLNDAQKEFEGDVKIGFGISGDVDNDFTAVRGIFEENKFVKKLNADIESVNNKCESIINLLNKN